MINSINIKTILANAQQQLLAHTESPRLDAEILLACVLKQTRTYLHTWPEKELSSVERQQFESFLARRCAGEPVSYITGTKEFWSVNLKVTPDTLIPRPETELLVETVLSRFPNRKNFLVADIGTGSGAIAIALAIERPDWEIYATDISLPALTIAKENAQRLAVNNISFLAGNWLAALPHKQFDVIVSNPPYISEEEWQQHHPGLAHEPVTALLSEKNGLADIEAILSSASAYLKSNGLLALEHGYAQGDQVRQLFALHGYKDIETVRDLAAHERVTLGR